MPEEPMVSPSEMTGVPKTKGLPPAASTAAATLSAISLMWTLQGVALV